MDIAAIAAAGIVTDRSVRSFGTLPKEPPEPPRRIAAAEVPSDPFHAAPAH